MSGLFCGLIILHFVWVNLVFLLKPGVMKVKMSETGSYLSVSVHFRPKFSLPSLFPDQLLAVQVWTVRRSAESQKNFFLLHYLHYLRLVFELIGYTEGRAQNLLIARERMSVFLSSPCKIKARPSVKNGLLI